MTSPLKADFQDEMYAARQAYDEARFDPAFAHLERAHIIGQQFFAAHWLSHWWMLKIGVRRGDSREIMGQIIRLIAVIPGFLFGWVPKGNTGGANVSATRPMPIPDDLSGLLADYSVWRDVRRRTILWILVIACAVTVSVI